VRYRLVVFDFDGTLVDTREPILLSINAALRSVGLPAREPHEILPLVGLGLERVLAQLAGGGRDAAAVGRMADAYRAHFDTVVAGRTRPFDGVVDALDRLAASGATLAIATSRGMASVEAILAAHGLRHRFALLVTAHCVPHTKPEPDMVRKILADLGAAPGDTVVVGDTTYDLAMGRAAGTATCGVTWGSHGKHALAPLADHLAERASDLPGVLRGGPRTPSFER